MEGLVASDRLHRLARNRRRHQDALLLQPLGNEVVIAIGPRRVLPGRRPFHPGRRAACDRRCCELVVPKNTPPLGRLPQGVDSVREDRPWPAFAVAQ